MTYGNALAIAACLLREESYLLNYPAVQLIIWKLSTLPKLLIKMIDQFLEGKGGKSEKSVLDEKAPDEDLQSCYETTPAIMREFWRLFHFL
jgi:hypothetical protein